jgi:hypothetical protein
VSYDEFSSSRYLNYRGIIVNIDFNELVDLAKATNATAATGAPNADSVKSAYATAFAEEVMTRLATESETATSDEISNLVTTNAAVDIIVANIMANFNNPATLETAGKKHSRLEKIYLQSVVNEIKASRSAKAAVAHTGAAKDDTAGVAAAAVPFVKPAPPAGHDAVGAPKGDIGAGIGLGEVVLDAPKSAPVPMGGPERGAPVPAALPVGMSYAIMGPDGSIVPMGSPTQMSMGGAGTPAAYVGGLAYPVATVVAVGGSGARTPASTGWTCHNCCQMIICCCDLEQQCAVGYTQGVFARQVFSGGPVDTTVAVGALAGGRPGFIGAVGNNAAQHVFCEAICRSCHSMTCCCTVPDWGCTMPAIACPDVGCPDVTCDGNPVVECLTAALRCGGDVCGTVAGLATNCFSFFGGAAQCVVGAASNCLEVAGGCAANCGECATCCGDAVGCVTGAAGGIVEIASACCGACGACAECCCSIANALPR